MKDETDVLNVGDIVISPLKNKVCVIVYLPVETSPYSCPYIVLSPLTKRGYPSLNRKLFVYLDPKHSARLKRHEKYSSLKLCPVCNGSPIGDCLRPSDLKTAMRIVSIYDHKYQCKACKSFFRIRSKVT